MTTTTALDDDRVTLRVNGRDFFGWTSVEIDTSIEDACSTFEVAVSGIYANTASAIVEDDDVVVLIGDDRVLTGVVDRVLVSGDAETSTVSIQGRSKTREAVDCSAPVGAWRGQRLSKLLELLLVDYDLEVVDEAGVGQQIVRSHRTEDGESIFDAVDRLGRDLGFLVTDDAAGRLVLTRAGNGLGDELHMGRAPVLSGSVSRSCAERFSHYVCQGQAFTDLEVDPAAQGGAEDVGVTRFRQLLVKPERGVSRAEAQKRAVWEATTRAAKALEASYAVRGWRQSDGTLWTKNQLVTVTDARGRLSRVSLLVVGVSFVLNGQVGRLASLRLAPKEAFTPPPQREVSVASYAWTQPDATAPELDDGGLQ